MSEKRPFKGRHIISTRDLTPDDYRTIMFKALRFKYHNEQYEMAFRNKMLIYMFFQPSTRTMNSSIEAMEGYGGRCTGFSDPTSTSVKKGESLRDTTTNFIGYGRKSTGNIIVVRHPNDGAARLVEDEAEIQMKKDRDSGRRREVIAVINGGDGKNQHPTQALGDLFTVWDKMLNTLGFDLLDKDKWPSDFNGVDMMGVGDMKYGRALKSTIDTLSAFNMINNLYLASHPYVGLNERTIEDLKGRVDKVHIINDRAGLAEAANKADIICGSRIQQLQFPQTDRGREQLKEIYDSGIRLEAGMLEDPREHLIIMHPQPFNSSEGDRTRVITKDVRDTPFEAWEDQSADLVDVRAALMHLQLYGVEGEIVA